MLLIVAAFLELIVVSAFVAALLFYFASEARSIIAGAPFSPLPEKLVPEIIAMAKLKADDAVADLGCGDGRILDAALAAGARSAIGYDVGWWPFIRARRRLKRWGDRVRLVHADARTAQLQGITLVYMYLFPGIVDTLAGYLAGRLVPGARVLCAAFPIDTLRHPEFRVLEKRQTGSVNSYLYERV